MNLCWLRAMLIFLPLPLMIYVMFSAPTSVEEENKKRIVMGKHTLTLEEFQRRVRKARIIACSILVACWVIAALMRL